MHFSRARTSYANIWLRHWSKCSVHSKPSDKKLKAWIVIFAWHKHSRWCRMNDDFSFNFSVSSIFLSFFFFACYCWTMVFSYGAMHFQHNSSSIYKSMINETKEEAEEEKSTKWWLISKWHGKKSTLTHSHNICVSTGACAVPMWVLYVKITIDRFLNWWHYCTAFSQVDAHQRVCV